MVCVLCCVITVKVLQVGYRDRSICDYYSQASNTVDLFDSIDNLPVWDISWELINFALLGVVAGEVLHFLMQAAHFCCHPTRSNRWSLCVDPNENAQRHEEVQDHKNTAGGSHHRSWPYPEGSQHAQDVCYSDSILRCVSSARGSH